MNKLHRVLHALLGVHASVAHSATNAAVAEEGLFKVWPKRSPARQHLRER
jgi:hypothetical protein